MPAAAAPRTANDMLALCSWSGGKDSCLACYKAIQQGYKIKTLVNFIGRESRRGCFHGVAGDLMRLQSERVGIPIAQWETTADMQKYEEEFKEAVSTLREEAGSMVFGDIYLLDHMSWIERVCGDLKIKPVQPLWERKSEDIIHEFIDLGFKTVIVSCKADVLGQEFVGKVIDKPLVEEFKKRGIDPCGENGEYHTLVVDGPLFSRPISILKAEPVLKHGFWDHWFLDIKEFA